ncbi:MAG TPA: sulfotransferase family 2 domain-containing protein [Pyrinomonadaceae bacterium]
MNFSSFATKDSANLVDAERLSRAKPVLFLHIPKTGGSSFLTVLGNVFGERRVRRLRRAEEMAQAQIDRIISGEIQDIDCLVGHFPIHAFAKCLDTFRPFTILRDPVDRVMSLFRFLKSAPHSEIERLGLPESFGFDDFIESRVPENHAQTRNMMCRMLCGDAEISDPSAAAFWQPRDPGALVDQALATLRGIDFGLVEDMQSTQTLLQHAWATKFNLGEYRKNATGTPGAEWTARNIQRIVDLNTLDVALYHEAKVLFYTRVRNDSALGRKPTSLPMLRVQPGQEISVNDIPGRRGFHEFEPGGGFAWLAANQTVLIGFLTPPKILRLRMTLYCVTDHFPAEEIEVTLNGARLTHRVAPIEGNWVSLETEAFRSNEKLNVLTLSPPYVIPVRFLHPASRDDRYLSVALEKLVFLE